MTIPAALGGLPTLFTGDPFGTAAIDGTEEEVLRDLRAKKPERCEINFAEGLLEIDLLDSFPWTNPCRVVFRGRFQQRPTGFQVNGWFEYGLFCRMFLLLYILVFTLLGITSRSWIVGPIVAVAALCAMVAISMILEAANRARVKSIKDLLNGLIEVGS
jgi:hypothetical protein